MNKPQKSPFDEMMKKIQKISTKIANVQHEMQGLAVDGQAGAGAITVSVNAGGSCLWVKINDSSLLADDKKAMLEELIASAFNDAKEKLTRAMSDKMEALGIPREVLEGNVGDMGGLMGGDEDDGDDE